MRRLFLMLLIALSCWSLAIACLRWDVVAGAKAQVQASDLFMVSNYGPRLGARATSSEIALLFFDLKTATDRGHIRSYSDDLQLYGKLLEAGAKVIYDSRAVIAADESTFEESLPILDGIARLNASQRILREIWLSTALVSERGQGYTDFMTQNVIDAHPHALPGLASRLYPLAYFTTTGVQESAPLVIYRKMRDLPVLSSPEVGDRLRSCGVMSRWHEFAPQVIPKTDIPASQYDLGDFQLSWQAFAPSTVLVPCAGYWVSYDPAMADYERLSYVDVLKGTSLPDLRGKAILIGYSAEVDPSSNTYEVPNLVGKAASIEVMACALQTLLDHRNTLEFPKPLFLTASFCFIAAMTLIAGFAKPIQAIFSCLGLLGIYFVVMTLAYRSGWYGDFLVTPLAACVSAIPAAAANAWLNLRARQKVIDLFGRYVPRAIVNQLMQQSELERLTLGGTKRDVTVMFADIRGFTSFSQHLPPEQVVGELNALLAVMVQCTFEYEGTLDKFIGDAILVLFNAPLDQPDHTLRAVNTALAIQARLKDHASGLRVGIGVHSGPAVIGNIGTPQRMEFTAIGRTVNVASRLCDLAAPGEIMISESVMRALDSRFAIERVERVTVKGISEELQVARVLGEL